jgi:hypothetical protein
LGLSDKPVPNYISTHLKGVDASSQTTLISFNLRYPVAIGKQQLYEAAFRFGLNKGIDLFDDADGGQIWL